MSVIKVKIQKDFTVLYNGVLENPNLSFKAKGLWAYCMSRPDNWQFHVNHLATVSKDGVDAIYSALKELEQAGLVQKQQSNEGGKFGPVDYIIYPYPEEIKIILPQRDFPETEDPQTENPALTRTDLITRTDTKVVCYPPPVGEDSNVLLSRILKKHPDGHEVEVSLENIFSKAVYNRKNWTIEEIQEAWKILSDHSGLIRDPWRFIEGTVDKRRNKKRSEFLTSKIKTKEKEQCTLISQTTNEFKEKALEIDSEEQHSLQYYLDQVDHP